MDWFDWKFLIKLKVFRRVGEVLRNSRKLMEKIRGLLHCRMMPMLASNVYWFPECAALFT